jgi:hypothetical protein
VDLYTVLHVSINRYIPESDSDPFAAGGDQACMALQGNLCSAAREPFTIGESGTGESVSSK